MFQGRGRRRQSVLGGLIRKILLLLLIFIIYILLGGILPFVQQKEVSGEFKNNFQITQFYRKNNGVDRAAIVETSQDALDKRIQMIASAKRKIRFTTFSMKPDESCKKVCAALYDAAERGVKVEMLVDGLSGSWDMKHAPMFYALGTHKNVSMKYYNIFYPYAPWTFNGRLHDKLIVVDDSLLILGGRNTSNYFLGNYNEDVLSYDREVFVYNTSEHVKDSVIGQVQEYFDTLWNFKESKAVYDKIPERKKVKVAAAISEYQVLFESMKAEQPQLWTPDYKAETIPVNHIQLVTNPIHTMSKEPWVWYTMEQLMLNAKEQVLIQTPYMVLNDKMYDSMEKIGEDLKEYEVLLNGIAIGDNICASSDYKLSRKDILATGIKVYEFQGKFSTHNKSLVIDHRLAVIGSYNFDMRSAYLDTETMLVIDSKEFAAQLEGCIKGMQKESLLVRTDETYEMDSKVEPVKMPDTKKFVFSFLPYIFKPIRFLL